MTEEQHPSEMNLLQQYLRTTKLAKSTSRMKNPAWYQAALDLDLQLHCYLRNEGDPIYYIFNKTSNSYLKVDGPGQRQVSLNEELEKFIQEVLSHDVAKKAKSLGVVFYLADELSIASLGPEHQNPVEIDNLRKLMIEEPTEVLDDKTVSSETHAWRLLPYPGAPAGNEFATAVAVSRKHDETLRKIREIGNATNFPILTCALSAPLCMISSLPWFTTAKETGTIGVYNYEAFTVLAFHNKHGDLMMVRYMPHTSGAKTPSNMGPAAMASATAFELIDPEINVVSMVGNDVEGMVISLQGSMPGSEILMVDTQEILKEKSMPEEIPFELVVATAQLDPEVYPMAANATFALFNEEGWHLQDFLSPDQEEVELYPSQEDMKLLKLVRRLKWAAAFVLLGVLGYAGYSSWSKVKSPAWTHKKQNNQATALTLKTELKRHEHWNNLLMDRSKAWMSMELVARLTPSDGSVILKDVKHRVDQKIESKEKKYGFRKEWVINGFMNEKGLPHLEKYSTREGINRLFREVAEVTGSHAYIPDVGNRDVTVNLTQRSNPTYNTVNPQRPSDRYRLAFTMTISQTFTGKDDLALGAITDTSKR